MMDLLSELYLSDVSVSKYLNISRSLESDFQDACLKSVLEVPDLIPNVQAGLKFDAVIGMPWPFSSCIGYVAHLLDLKLIQIYSSGPFSQTLQSTGNAYNMFVFPMVGNTYFLEPLTFPQRIVNVLNDWIMNYVSRTYMKNELKHMKREFPDLPNSYEDYFQTRSVLSLVNSNLATHGSWPMYPNTIEIGGMHVKPGE